LLAMMRPFARSSAIGRCGLWEEKDTKTTRDACVCGLCRLLGSVLWGLCTCIRQPHLRANESQIPRNRLKHLTGAEPNLQ
jgi:hypothetical protein